MPVWDADYADRYADYDDRDADYADFGDGDDYEDDCEWWCMFIWFCTG